MAGYSIDVLDILDKSRGYDIALLTTFNFEIAFFEKAILSRLVKNSIKKISVFVDAKELAKAIKEACSTVLGQRYVVNPVTINGSYHPKIILLLGENKARLIVGSGNLKTSGYYINNEVFDYVDYNADHQENRALIVDAIRFFLFSNNLTPGLDSELLKEVSERPYYRPAPKNYNFRLIENSTYSILSQVKETIPEMVREIMVAVPYYDGGLNALQTVCSAFPEAKTELYLQRGKSTFPGIESPDQSIQLNVFDQVATDNKNGHFYHGKVFLFKSDNQDYMLFGSSNCTQSAITKSIADGGNAECDLFVRGEPGELSGFFSIFVLSDSSNPESRILSYSTEDKTNFSFKYGVMDSTLTLHLGYKKDPERLLITYKNEPVFWEKSDKEIIVQLDPEMIEQSIFDIKVSFDEATENVTCWYIDKLRLAFFRTEISATDILEDRPDFGEGEKYCEDYERLLREVGCATEDLLQQQKIIQPFLSMSNLSEEADLGESEDSEDFVVNVTLSDDDYVAFKQYKVMERLRMRMTERYLQGTAYFFDHDRYRSQTSSMGMQITVPAIRKTVTTEEKRFAGFVNRIVRNAERDEFFEAVSEEHYVGLLSLLFDVFDKYHDVEGMFQRKNLVEDRCKLVIRLLKKITKEETEVGPLISRILGIFLDNHLIITEIDDQEVRTACEIKNRRALLALEEKYHLRNTFLQYFAVDKELYPEEVKILVAQASEYVNHLYGYNSLVNIQIELSNRLKTECEITQKRKVVYVKIHTKEPNQFLKPDGNLIRELIKYSDNVQKLSRIEIEIVDQDGLSPIARIQHRIKLPYMNWNYTLYRKNGTKMESPYTFVSI